MEAENTLPRRRFARQGRLVVMILLTTTFFVVEIVVGYLTGSLALVADSFHMLSDVMALIVALYAIRLAKKNTATKGNSYGWQRAEILGALVNGVFLLALCFTIVIEAIQRFFEITEIENPTLVLIVGGVGLFINLIGLIMFAGSGGHGHSHGGSGGHGHSHGGKAKGSHSHSHEGNEDHGHSHEGGGKHGHSHESGAHGHSHGNTNSGQLHADDDGDHDEPESGELPLTPLGDSAPGSSKTIVQLQVGETYKAKRDYTPTKDKYLSMKKGDLVFVVSSIKPNLYIGRVNGEEGRFNAKRVKIPSGENITPSALSLTETLELKPPADFDQDLEKGLGPKTQHEGGHNMKAVFLHVLGDALGSVGVIFVSLMIWLTDLSWKYYLDPVISLVITAIIVYGTVPLVKHTALVLLQGVPDFDFAGLRASLRNLVGVKGVHEVHVWRLADNKLVGSAHLMVEDLQDGAQVSMKAKKVFHQYDVHSSTIQTECLRVVGSDSETDVEDTSDTACLISCEKDCAEKGCCPPSASQSARVLNDPSHSV